MRLRVDTFDERELLLLALATLILDSISGRAPLSRRALAEAGALGHDLERGLKVVEVGASLAAPLTARVAQARG